MAQGNNSWFDFMQSRTARIICNAIVIVACVRHAIDAALTLLNPQQHTQLLDVMGTTVFYLVHIAQLVILSIIVVSFTRGLIRIIKER